MDEFEVGDRVRVRKNWGFREYPDGREGVIKDVFCDYGDHRVGVLFDGDEMYVELNEDMFELINGDREADYEYAATWLDPKTGEYFGILEHEWTTVEGALQSAKTAEEVGDTGVKLVKRRKAGKVEDV